MLAPGGGERVCVECGATCDQETRCSRCEMPLCCESRLHESECRHRIHFPTNTSRHLGVAILRLIDNLETRNTEQREEIMQLMSHLESRRCDPDYDQMLDTVRLLTPVLGDRYTEHELLEHAGIILTNTLQCNTVSGGVDSGIGLFPLFSLLSHSCVANTRREADGGKIKLIATVHISTGDQILTSYKNPLLGSVSRRCHFPRIWYFDCECRRCCDPTELGSHLSSLKCEECEAGVLLPSHPEQYHTPWSCDQCQLTISSHQAITRTIVMFRALMSCPTSIITISSLINNLQTIAHPQHYVIIQVCIKTYFSIQISHLICKR